MFRNIGERVHTCITARRFDEVTQVCTFLRDNKADKRFIIYLLLLIKARTLYEVKVLVISEKSF